MNALTKKTVQMLFPQRIPHPLDCLLVCLFACLPRFRLLARLFLCPLTRLLVWLFTCSVAGSFDRLLDEEGNETNKGRTAMTEEDRGEEEIDDGPSNLRDDTEQ